MIVNIKRMTDTAKLPSKGSAEAAGFDLYADINEPLLIFPNETIMIPTGIAVAIPKGYFGAIYARSGLAVKSGLKPANCVGVVDSDYRGEVKVALNNSSVFSRTISPQERVAQFVIQPYPDVEWNEVEDLDDTERGAGGFGSTGLQ